MITRGVAADQPSSFDDADLAALLHRVSSGVIYLWSPHMPYSLAGAAEARGVATELGLQPVLLLDPYADAALAIAASRKHRLPATAMRRARADALWRMGATQHFPTAVVFESGRLDAQMLPGYTPPADLRAFIRQRLNRF